MDKTYIDLFTLQEIASGAVENAFPEALWVKAELSNVSVKSNGHCYMELSQSDAFGALVAKAKAVIWRSRYSSLMKEFVSQTGQALEPGMEVLLKVQASYSPLWGFTLTVEDIDGAFVLGQRELQRRETLQRLRDEHLLDLQKELCLPPLPYRLAVVSAAGAAGLGDFRKHLSENEYGFKFKIDLFEAVMQGAGAPPSIIEALEAVENSAHPYDVVLILRGGGSELDLACFDDYALAAAIARCPVPVFTAIGHERDNHVADMVANTFVKTPTALADLLLDCYISEDQRISALESALKAAYTSRIGVMELRLNAVYDALRTAVYGRLANAEAALAVLETKIAASNPEEILRRGFAIATDGKGVRLNSALGCKPGDRVSVRLRDGRIDCTVNGVAAESL